MIRGIRGITGGYGGVARGVYKGGGGVTGRGGNFVPTI